MSAPVLISWTVARNAGVPLSHRWEAWGRLSDGRSVLPPADAGGFFARSASSALRALRRAAQQQVAHPLHRAAEEAATTVAELAILKRAS